MSDLAHPPPHAVQWEARSLSSERPGRCVVREQLWAAARERAAAALGVNTDAVEVRRADDDAA